MLASFLVGVQLARGLGVEGFGYYALALSVLVLAGVPAELGLSRLVTREVARASAKSDSPAIFAVLRWANLTCWRISAVVVAGIIVAAIVLRDSNPTLANALLLGAPAVPFMALARIHGGALQGLHHIVRGQIPANLLRPAFFSVLLALAYLLGLSISPESAMLLSSVTAAMVLLIAQYWLGERLPPPIPAKPVVDSRRWLGSTIPLALTDGIRSLQSELTILILGLLLVAADVGLFRIAVVTATIAAAPMAVLIRVAMPMIARFHAEGDLQRLQSFVTYAAWAQTAGVLALSLPLLIAPELLLSLVFGESFSGAADALRIIAAAQIANAAFGPNTALLNMTHHERLVTRAMAIALVLNITTVLLFVSTWGLLGGAVGLSLSLLCWNVLTWLDGRRVLGIDTSIIGARPGALRC